MNNENEFVDETTQTEEAEVVEVEETEEQETESPEDVIARLKKENQSLKIQKGKMKAKAEKVVDTPQPQKVELSNMDILAIAKSDVHEEDIERVTKFAQMEGISVKDALGNEDMKAILERRAETRKVAKASNTDSAKGSPSGATGDSLLQNAQSGKMPDPKDLKAMWDAETKR